MSSGDIDRTEGEEEFVGRFAMRFRHICELPNECHVSTIRRLEIYVANPTRRCVRVSRRYDARSRGIGKIRRALH